jgi:hypothetical protein
MLITRRPPTRSIARPTGRATIALTIRLAEYAPNSADDEMARSVRMLAPSTAIE